MAGCAGGPPRPSPSPSMAGCAPSSSCWPSPGWWWPSPCWRASASPETFVGYDAGTVDVVAFAAVVVLGPPVAIWLVEQLVGLAGARARRLAHLVALFALVSGLLIQVGKEVSDLGYKRLPLVAGVLAVGVTWIIARSALARLFLRFLAAAPLAFAMLFLAASPVTAVAFPGDDADVGRGIEVGDPAPVVMIVLDELPTVSLLDGEGEIDARSYPNLARFTGDATWYRNHTTVAQQTEKAVPALLTGVVPPRELVAPLAAEYERNLFSMLEGSHDVRASEAATGLCIGACEDGRSSEQAAVPQLLGDAVHLWREQASPRRSGGSSLLIDLEGAFRAASTRAVEDVDEFAASLGPSRERPRLDFLHVMLPHSPWRYRPDGTSYAIPSGTPGFGRWPDEPSARASRQRHLLQVAFLDELLGRVFDRLRALGTYDETLVVLTADHGVAFQSGQSARAAADATFSEILWVPLLVKSPGQVDGGVTDIAARSVDVLPTIADHLQVELEWELDGSSLLVDGARSQRRVTVLPPAGLFASVDETATSFDRDEGLQRVLGGAPPALCGPVARLPAAFRLGPLASQHGRRADARAVTGETFEGSLDDSTAFDNVDFGSRSGVPGLVTGEVTATGGGEVVVVVNGRVAGSGGLTQRDDDATDEDVRSFEVLIESSFLRNGDNEVELFLAEGSAEEPRLTRVELEE